MNVEKKLNSALKQVFGKKPRWVWKVPDNKYSVPVEWFYCASPTGIIDITSGKLPDALTA